MRSKGPIWIRRSPPALYGSLLAYAWIPFFVQTTAHILHNIGNRWFDVLFDVKRLAHVACVGIAAYLVYMKVGFNVRYVAAVVFFALLTWRIIFGLARRHVPFPQPVLTGQSIFRGKGAPPSYSPCPGHFPGPCAHAFSGMERTPAWPIGDKHLLYPRGSGLFCPALEDHAGLLENRTTPGMGGRRHLYLFTVLYPPWVCSSSSFPCCAVIPAPSSYWHLPLRSCFRSASSIGGFCVALPYLPLQACCAHYWLIFWYRHPLPLSRFADCCLPLPLWSLPTTFKNSTCPM